jgi:hypothetical protein
MTQRLPRRPTARALLLASLCAAAILCPVRGLRAADR